MKFANPYMHRQVWLNMNTKSDYIVIRSYTFYEIQTGDKINFGFEKYETCHIGVERLHVVFTGTILFQMRQQAKWSQTKRSWRLSKSSSKFNASHPILLLLYAVWHIINFKMSDLLKEVVITFNQSAV